MPIIIDSGNKSCQTRIIKSGNRATKGKESMTITIEKQGNKYSIEVKVSGLGLISWDSETFPTQQEIEDLVVEDLRDSDNWEAPNWERAFPEGDLIDYDSAGQCYSDAEGGL